MRRHTTPGPPTIYLNDCRSFGCPWTPYEPLSERALIPQLSCLLMVFTNVGVCCLFLRYDVQFFVGRFRIIASVLHTPCLIYWTRRNHQYGLRLENWSQKEPETAGFEPGISELRSRRSAIWAIASSLAVWLSTSKILLGYYVMGIFHYYCG